MTNAATTAHAAAVLAMREAGFKIDAEETYENLAAEMGWDAIEEGENPENFLRPGDFPLSDPDFPNWDADDDADAKAYWDERAAELAAEADLPW